MGGASAGTGGSDDRDEKKIDTYSDQYNKLKKEEAKKSKYKTDKFGYKVKKNPIERYVDNSFITNNPFSKKSEEVNRKYFEETVKPAGKSKYDNYEDYIRARGRGEVDAYGRTITKRDNDNPPSQTIIKKTAGGQTVQTTAPTEAELSQSAAADAEAYDLRKTKKKGRSMNTLTSSQGVTDDKLTLGKKSLLGS